MRNWWSAVLCNLEQTRCAHAAAYAHCADHVFRTASFAFDQGMRDHSCTAHAVGVTDANCESRDNVTLSRNAQYQLGTHLATIGDAPLTIRAFDDFLAAYSKDPESVQIRILLARFCVSIGAIERARRLLTEAIETARNESVRSLAKSELAALGAPEDNAGTQVTE